MLHIFITAFNAIMPICLLIAFGFFLRASGFVNENFTNVGNKLTFQYLLPIMLFMNVYKVESLADMSWGIVLYCAVGVAVLFLIGVKAVPGLTPDPRRKGVLLQAVFRSNTTVIGVTLAEALGGAEAVAVASIVGAFSIPLLNIFAVLALSMYVTENGQKPSARSVIRKIVTNPLIDWIVAALLLQVLRYAEIRIFGYAPVTLKGNLPFLYSALNSLGISASPLALVILGTQFSLSEVGDMRREIIWGSVWRLILAPLIVITPAILLTLCTPLLNFGPAEFPSLIAMFATPAAVSSAVMARQMGSDGPLSAQLVVWTSLASLLTLFVLVSALMALGLLSV